MKLSLSASWSWRARLRDDARALRERLSLQRERTFETFWSFPGVCETKRVGERRRALPEKSLRAKKEGVDF